jgi:hypothetical protein
MKLLPGLSFSWKRAFGLTRLRAHLSRSAGIPTSRAGLHQKVGRKVFELLLGTRRRP